MNWLESLLREMAAHGLMPANDVISDGAIQRFHVEGDRPGKKAGWYVIHEHPYPIATFGSWRTGEQHTWRGGAPDAGPADRCATRDRIASNRRQRERELAGAQRDAAEKAIDLWRNAREPSSTHRYLRGKAVGVHGIRQLGESLVVPLHDGSEVLCNLQFIDGDGRKRFLRGGRVKGLFQVIGGRTPRVWLAEGYATAASVHNDFGECVVLAFSANNLLAVATEIQRAWDPVTLVVMADDDALTPGNPGIAAAKEVAKKLGIDWYIPEFPPDRPPWATDYNDAARLWLTRWVSA